jgi:polyisoprenyl-phosphate glycosyltransferase
MTRKVSFVISVCNEEKNLPLLLEELSKLQGSFQSFEAIFIDDGSTDGSFSVLEDFCSRHSWSKLIQFSRNFGHEASIKAGITASTGDAICILDADLQHPPEIARQLAEGILAGKDVLFGRRKVQGIPGFSLRRIFSTLYYFLLRHLTRLPFKEGFTDFFAISRRVKEYLIALQEHYSFARGQIIWPFSQVEYIEYEGPQRKYGKTKYNLRKLFGIAMYSIFTYSRIPVTYFLIASFLSIIVALYILLSSAYDKYVLKLNITGFPTIYGLFFLLLGINVFFCSIIIEYILLIFQNQENRPRYFITKKVNFEGDDPPV